MTYWEKELRFICSRKNNKIEKVLYCQMSMMFKSMSTNVRMCYNTSSVPIEEVHII